MAKSGQHVLVAADDAEATRGRLYRFHNNGGRWAQAGPAVPVTLGKRGVGKRREGDGRAPEGVYPLTTAFGYADRPPEGAAMPYLPLTPTMECVDDAASPHYNRILDAAAFPSGTPWTSSEKMRRDIHHGDDLYKWGLVVDYNPRRRPGAGSCIFLHLWRGPDDPTAGCTAMAERDFLDLLRWLDPAKSPVLVQGTRAFLRKLRRGGALPYDVPAAAAGSGPDLSRRGDMVPLSGPWLTVDLKYTTADNFMGEDLYGDFDRCFLHEEAARKLEKAGSLLRERRPGWRLKTFDCLRPRSIQWKLWRRVEGTAQESYVADPRQGSIHNFGFAVDLSVEDAEGRELDMGTPFDDFTPLSEPRLEEKYLRDGKLTSRQIENRRLLRGVMEDAGFIPLPNEWWHFDARPKDDVRKNHRIVE
ncbi:MAG: M15 family metallopeptidase [Elusimicrobiota bacterium]